MGRNYSYKVLNDIRSQSFRFEPNKRFTHNTGLFFELSGDILGPLKLLRSIERRNFWPAQSLRIKFDDHCQASIHRVFYRPSSMRCTWDLGYKDACEYISAEMTMGFQSRPTFLHGRLQGRLVAQAASLSESDIFTWQKIRIS